MFGIAPPIHIATDVVDVVVRRFPKDPMLSKFRILVCKIEGIASWGLWTSAIILSTSLSSILLSSYCWFSYCINIIITEKKFFVTDRRRMIFRPQGSWILMANDRRNVLFQCVRRFSLKKWSKLRGGVRFF